MSLGLWPAAVPATRSLTMPDVRPLGCARNSAWVREWGPLLPILIAILIVMLGSAP